MSLSAPYARSMNFSDVFVRKAGTSYVYHHCSVIKENDVLKFDIPGDDLKARLKRWWWNLFLVSDNYNHSMYTSSHGLRMERLRQYKRHKNMIHPLSRFRALWDCIILHLLVLYDFLFHLTTSVYFGDLSSVPYLINAFIEIVRIFDIFLNLHTGYIEEITKKVELDTVKVFIHYCSTKLFFHTMASIPLTWLIFLRYGSSFDCSLCKINQFITVLKILNIFNLIRVYQCSEYWIQQDTVFFQWNEIYKLLRIFVLGLLTMLQFREVSDVIVFQIMAANGEIVRVSRFGNGIFLRHVYYPSRASWPFNLYKLFIYDISRFFKCFFLYSFNPRIEYILDRLVSLVGVVIIKTFFLWTFFECYLFIATKLYANDNVILTENMATNMLRSFQLSDALETKVCKYFDYKMSTMKLIESTNTIIKALPKVLRDEAFTEFYSRYLTRISYFTLWPEDVIVDLVLMLNDCIYLSGDLVVEPWLEAEGLVIVAHGELAVYTNDEETGHLIDGDYFGELSLVTDLEIRTSSVVTISPSLVLILKKGLFRSYMRQYPDLFYALEEALYRKFGDETEISTQLSKQSI